MRTIPVQGPLCCPRDRTELTPFRIGEVSVDTCGRCSGVWLDAGELARVAHDEEMEQLVRASVDAVPSAFACPRCAGVCRAAKLEGVEMDSCAACGGIWVDAGELRAARVGVMVRRAAERAGVIGTLRAVAGRDEDRAATRAR